MASERDQFLIGEHVTLRVLVTVDGVEPANLSGTTLALVIQPPPDENGAERAEVNVTVTPSSGGNASGTYDTEFAGWHEWRWVTTGTIIGAQQGRFRVLPINT